jgi:hypothetical protein
LIYELEKSIWTDEDFEQMGWHDCNIYRFRLQEDLELDIDYILKWNPPDMEGLPFTFWVAPATLVFKKIRLLGFDLDVGLEDAFEIDDIERNISGNEVSWEMLTRRGNIEFVSNGFEQYIRQQPSFQFGQRINYFERGGFSLERTIRQHNPNLLNEDLQQRKTKDLEHYENVKKRHLKKKELDELNKLRENREVDTKQYLLKKKEIQDWIFHYDYWLKGTQFESW